MSTLPPLSAEELAQLLHRARSTTPEQRVAWLFRAQQLEAELRASRIAAGLPVVPRDWEDQVRAFSSDQGDTRS